MMGAYFLIPAILSGMLTFFVVRFAPHRFDEKKVDYIANLFTWFFTTPYPEARRPVYVLTIFFMIPSLLSIVTGFTLKDGLFCGNPIWAILFQFILLGFGFVVFDGRLKYSNNFCVLTEDGKAQSPVESFFSMAKVLFSVTTLKRINAMGSGHFKWYYTH